MEKASAEAEGAAPGGQRTPSKRPLPHVAGDRQERYTRKGEILASHEQKLRSVRNAEQ